MTPQSVCSYAELLLWENKRHSSKFASAFRKSRRLNPLKHLQSMNNLNFCAKGKVFEILASGFFGLSTFGTEDFGAWSTASKISHFLLLQSAYSSDSLLSDFRNSSDYSFAENFLVIQILALVLVVYMSFAIFRSSGDLGLAIKVLFDLGLAKIMPWSSVLWSKPEWRSGDLLYMNRVIGWSSLVTEKVAVSSSYCVCLVKFGGWVVFCCYCFDICMWSRFDNGELVIEFFGFSTAKFHEST